MEGKCNFSHPINFRPDAGQSGNNSLLQVIPEGLEGEVLLHSFLALSAHFVQMLQVLQHPLHGTTEVVGVGVPEPASVAIRNSFCWAPTVDCYDWCLTVHCLQRDNAKVLVVGSVDQGQGVSEQP